MTSLMVEAMKKLTAKANLQDNQALYNVRISSPGVQETYMAYIVLSVLFWFESRYAVTLWADVIELQ